MARPAPTSSGDARVDRAVAFELETDALAAERADDHPLGVALHSRAHPTMWVLNCLWVLGEHPELGAPALLDELDGLYAASAHRRVVIPHEATAAAVAPGLRAAGFTADRVVVMPLEGEPPEPPAGVARELDGPAWRAAELACALDDMEPGHGDPRELAGGWAALRRRPGTRTWVGTRDGVDACVTTLFTDGRIGQPESVTTLKAHRGHGLASATVSAAARAALAAGCELVFILAEDGSAAERVYTRLGFRTAGALWMFTRPSG